MKKYISIFLSSGYTIKWISRMILVRTRIFSLVGKILSSPMPRPQSGEARGYEANLNSLGSEQLFFFFFFKYSLRTFGPICGDMVRLRQSPQDSRERDS